MIASMLSLNFEDIRALGIRDGYSLHRVVYDLFDDIRTKDQKKASVSSGILYADKGGDRSGKKILILSNRQPNNPKHGQLHSKPIPGSFLEHDTYNFEVIFNPTKRDKFTRKLIPVIGREALIQWFLDKTLKSYGFEIKKRSLQIKDITVNSFDKKGERVTQGSVTFLGTLIVSNREKFICSFRQGIGRGRAFGFGLLQIVPILNPLNL